MVTLIIAMLAIFVLIIQRAESNIKNAAIVAKIQQFHSNVRSQMNAIAENPYAETRRASTKCIVFLFFLMAILNYVSEGIFGTNSVHNLLHDGRGLVFMVLVMIILAGHFNRRDFYGLTAVVVLAIGLYINRSHNHITVMGNAQFVSGEFLGGLLWKDLFVILGGAGFLGLVILFVLLSSLISFLLYRVIRFAFKWCLELYSEQPLKPLIFILQCLFILGVAVLAVI
ncbi:hypothetical protein AAW12_24085 [Sphingobacterium sp. Ag1]|uniref:hypothetical protein n=1 Tax=Sphingobacterium sp. Ag1 TaxID=1643451 RepID=UPI0006280DD4|nr:hypothetical protein [Sphingobacterium sp. Ag1]KKO89206.1 hypothetical protein AAW12_24085 [Sphingobacterium sp. Ag1]